MSHSNSRGKHHLQTLLGTQPTPLFSSVKLELRLSPQGENETCKGHRTVPDTRRPQCSAVLL